MKFRKTIVAALLAAVLLSTFAWAASPAGVRFDFETGDSGFTPIDADYPVGNGVDEFYELQHSWGAVPDGGSGLFLSGNNHSDDLFMGYVKKLTGFQPEQLYAFRVSFRLATNVAGGLIGVGGSPGSSVFVKGGITANEPKSIADDMQQHRLNIDKGNQGAGGCDMRLLGNLEKEETLRPGEYEWKNFAFTMLAETNAEGCVYLILETDSGFEAVSAYYLDDISVDWNRQDDMVLTRGAAMDLIFAALPGAIPFDPTFPDIRSDAAYRTAVGWAQGTGLVLGYSAQHFGGDDSLTFAQAMTIFYRLAGSPAVSATHTLPGETPSWAKDAAAWWLENGWGTAQSLRFHDAVTLFDFIRLLRLQGLPAAKAPLPHI